MLHHALHSPERFLASLCGTALGCLLSVSRQQARLVDSSGRRCLLRAGGGHPNGFTTFSIEVVITNDSPRANIVIAYYDLELPWKDEDFDPLSDPGELDLPSEFYKIHPESIQVARDKVLNHRRYQNGKLGPGEAFRGHFLAKGGSPIPEDLRKTERVEVRFTVQDTKGKEYRSGAMYLHLH